MTGNAQIIEGVKADRTGIGYVGAGYVSPEAKESQGIKILKIKKDKQSESISPMDQDAINNGVYYFQRPLYQFILAKSWDKVRPFINFERSPNGRVLIEDHGYYILENQKNEI